MSAANLYHRALRFERKRHTESRAMVYMAEMNACIHRGAINPSDIGIKSALVRHVPLDIKVNLIWDFEKANVDLIVKNSLLEIYRGEMHYNKYDYWTSIGDVSQGTGPESSGIHEKMPGDYTFTAKFRGEWNDTHKSDTTVSMEVIRNFGSETETRESITRRLHESDRTKFMTLKIAPAK